MTRDEAAKIVREVNQLDVPGEGYREALQKWSEMMVDALAALGVLKLDKPMSAQESIVACRCGWQGRQAGLNGNLCPKCSAQFKAWP